MPTVRVERYGVLVHFGNAESMANDSEDDQRERTQGRLQNRK